MNTFALGRFRSFALIALAASVAACQTTNPYQQPFNIMRPVNAPQILSDYGDYSDLSGKSRTSGAHNGIDWGYRGDTVISAGDGYVRRSLTEDYNGEFITIDRGRDAGGMIILSGYSHLQTRLVQVGEWVSRGQPIGIVGWTGREAGPSPHPHFSTYKNSSRVHTGWKNVNPHQFWVNGPGVVSCYEAGREYSKNPYDSDNTPKEQKMTIPVEQQGNTPTPIKLTVPLPCL